MLVVLAAGAASPLVVSAQTITGRVTSQTTGEPLPEVQVTVVGTNLGASTNADGRYTLRGVPAGTQTVRALRIGLQEQKQQVAVTEGQPATLDFKMADAVLQLQQVVTTATGQQRRVELGNAISTVNVAQRTAEAPVTDMATLMAAQSPGVQVEAANTIGVGARIRIRGVNSLSLANDPIYIIDGVRMTSTNGSISGNIFTGGAEPSRANDLDPDDIESIEIVKGPSAATLYGTDASNGVVVITTKHGHAGETRFNVSAEGGMLQDRNTWPTAYYLEGHKPGTTAEAQCFLTQVSAGTCQVDSLRSFNLFSDPNTTPLKNGYSRAASVNVSGGSDAVRFYTSAKLENESGILTIPQFDRQRFDTLHVNVLPEWLDPNAQSRKDFRANLNATLTPTLDAQVQAGFIQTSTRLPQNDNDAYGLLSNAFGGPGFETSGPGYTGISSLGYELHGYRANTPGESFQETVTQGINRFIGAVNLNWHPTSWWMNRADFGLDNTGRLDHALCRRGNCSNVGSHRLGYVEDDRATFSTITTNVTSTATFNPRSWLGSRTTIGMQWVSSSLDGNDAGGSDLTIGATTVNAGAIVSAGEFTTQTKTLGLFAEEQLSFNDRLYLTGALRSDQNSAFGTNFQQVIYPKASLSWIMSDESFFPKLKWLDQFRLRGAYGASGVQPGPTDALQYYVATTANVQAKDEPGVTYQSIGNANLKPERATEFEGGFDATMFGSRATLNLTYYHKLTHDALVNTIIPPSLGTGATSQVTNLGSVKNSGFEAMLEGQIIDRPSFGWDLTLNGSTNTNELVTLGTDASGQPIPPIVGTTLREEPGYPLYGWWQRPYTYSDANGDGILTKDEVHVADSAAFIGYSTPRYEASLLSGFDLFKKTIRINATFDYQGGYVAYDATDRIRCSSRNNCRGASDPSASLAEQAAAVGVREEGNLNTYYGFMQDGSFVRFRELSVTYALPHVILSRIPGGRSASINFAARNLHLWTKYQGIDPESNASVGSTDTAPSDFQTMPPPTYFVLRLNVGF